MRDSIGKRCNFYHVMISSRLPSSTASFFRLLLQIQADLELSSRGESKAEEKTDGKDDSSCIFRLLPLFRM